MNKEEILTSLNLITNMLEKENKTTEAANLNDVFMKIAKSNMPDEMEGGHKSPPKDYPKSKSKYADPSNYKYPIDTEAHARAAWAYIHQARNRKKYDEDEFNFICNKIKKALKKFKVEIEEKK